MKKTKLLLVAIAILASYSLTAQMAVTTDGSSADASAMFEIKSTEKGMLIPRMTYTQRTDITSPATGLLVYQTNLRNGYYYNSGTPASPSWVPLVSDLYTADRALQTNADGIITTSSVTDSELGYLTGASGNIQGQINGLSSSASRQNAVKDIIGDNTDFPPTENAGDRYILSCYGGSPHANWDGPSPGDIVEFDGSTWNATTPAEGMVVYDDDSNTDYLYIDDGTPEWYQRTILSTALSQGKIFIGDGSGEAVEQAVTGDVTINDAGVTAIGSSKVTNDMLAGSITNDKLTNGDYMITSAGTSGQVWTSDGSGAGVWSTRSGSSQWTTSGSNICFNMGNVGIGTSSPSYTLHVNGSVAGTSAYNNLSDARLKKDVLAIEHSLDKVMALRPVTFNWNKTVNTDLILDDRNHIGFIAQEVEEVFPQVISTADDEMKTKSIAYSDLVPVLTMAIQEQQAQIEALKAQNETLMLKAEAFEQLKADVEILKKAISSDIVQRISND